jgi:hypothetical protein
MPVNVTIDIIINVENVEFLILFSISFNLIQDHIIFNSNTVRLQINLQRFCFKKNWKELNSFLVNQEIDLQFANT